MSPAISVPVASAIPVDGPPGIPHVAASQMDMTQLAQLMHAQQQQMATMLHHLVSKQSTSHQPDVGTGIGAYKGLDERHFRRLEKFDNKSESWKEWRTHFRTAVRENSPITADVMEKAESEEIPILADKVKEANPSYTEAIDLRFSLHSRLVSPTTGVSLAVVESSGTCGLEAWRLLSQRYNPRTHSRCVQLLRKIGNYHITNIDNVLTGLVQWEGMVGVLARDHKEVLPDKMRIALLISVPPNALQEGVMEHLGRLTTYGEAHDEVVSLVNASSKYPVGDAMDCSSLAYDQEELDIDAVARDQCSNCLGYGHFSRNCPSPKGKAKGGGKYRPAHQEDQRPGKGGGAV